MPTLGDVVRRASRALEAAGWDASSAWLDAEVLARAILHADLTAWLLRQDEPAADEFQAVFDAAIARRLKHEPVAYITGEREFYGRTFRVSDAVLIPRPETELIVDEVLRLAARGPAIRQIGDVGTGSGILAITMALEMPESRVVATDISTAALSMAAMNVEILDLAERVDLKYGALLADSADAAFDLIVSNPPYVADRDRAGLMPDVRDYEPATALFGGPDGLDVIRSLLPAAERGLRPLGWLVMEMGAGQSAAVTDLLERTTHMSLLTIANDLAGIPRVLVAQKQANL